MNSFRYSFDHVYEYDGRVFVCERDLHFTESCSLHEIKEENGELILLTIFEYGYLNFSGYCFENNYMYFYSTGMRNGLYKLNLDNYELECLYWRLSGSIHVDSLFKKENFIYIYGSWNLIRYDLNTNDYEVFTNLEYHMISDEMHANGKKLFELWEELTD